LRYDGLFGVYDYAAGTGSHGDYIDEIVTKLFVAIGQFGHQ